MKPENEEEAATSREVVAVVVAATATTTTVVASRSGRSKTPSNFIGRHRLQAAISHLDQQIRMIQVYFSVFSLMGFLLSIISA